MLKSVEFKEPHLDLDAYLQDPAGTRRRALDAAAKLFRARGFAEVSMVEVAQAIDLSKPGLYHHWSSKDALLQTIVRLSGELLLAHLENVLATERDPVARLRSYIVTRLETVADYQDFFTVMWQERATVGAAGFEELASRAEVYRSRIRNLIDDAKKAGGLRKSVDTHLLMLALDGMTGWAYAWYRPGQGQTPAQIGEAFWNMLSDGILAQPTR
jgi:AcrR family transcriptional regulator